MSKEKDNGKSTALTVVQNYAIAAHEPGEIVTILAEVAGPGGVSNFDLDQLRIPAGGGSAWEVPTLDGEPDVTKVLEGIIVHHQDARAYWKVGMEDGGGSQPPDCSSSDGRIGMGDPGGDCTACPLAQFGSDDKGRGQACKAIKLIYLLTKDSLLPMALQVPPSGIKHARQYLMRLAGRSIRAHQVVTRIALEKTANPDGIAYSKPVFSRAGDVEEAMRPRVEQYVAAIREALKARKPVIQRGDVEVVNA